jgi:glycosyltransferase involved in cell wall biosynthesis
MLDNKSEQLIKVAILGPIQSSSYFGGTATVVEELALAFRRRGNEPTIVTLEKPDLAFSLLDGITIFSPSSAFGTLNIGVVFKMIQIASFLQRRSFDLVISNLYYSAFLSIANASIKIHIINGMGHYVPTLQGWFRAQVGNYSNIVGAKLSDRVIANSYLTSAIYSSIYGVHSTVVPLGVPSGAQLTPVNQIDSRDIDVLYAGRLAEVKALPILLEAIVYLIASLKRTVTLHVIGDGPEASNLHLLAKKLGIEEHVKFYGFIPRDQLAAYYARACCFVSVQPTEPFGLTYLEALANGTPIVVCRGNGFSPFCDNRFSCLVDCYPKSVAEGIEKALKTRWNREWIASYTLENFSWDRTLHLIMNSVYNKGEKIK